MRKGSMMSFRAKLWSSVASITSLSSRMICLMADFSAGMDCPIWYARVGRKVRDVMLESEHDILPASAPRLAHWSAMSSAIDDLFPYCRTGYLSQQTYRPPLLSNQLEMCESRLPGATSSISSWGELRSVGAAPVNASIESSCSSFHADQDLSIKSPVRVNEK